MQYKIFLIAMLITFTKFNFAMNENSTPARDWSGPMYTATTRNLAIVLSSANQRVLRTKMGMIYREYYEENHPDHRACDIFCNCIVCWEPYSVADKKISDYCCGFVTDYNSKEHSEGRNFKFCWCTALYNQGPACLCCVKKFDAKARDDKKIRSSCFGLCSHYDSDERADGKECDGCYGCCINYTKKTMN